MYLPLKQQKSTTLDVTMDMNSGMIVLNPYLYRETCCLVQLVFCLGGREQSTMSRTRISPRGTDILYVFGMVKSDRLSPRTGITTPHAHSTTGLATTTVI